MRKHFQIRISRYVICMSFLEIGLSFFGGTMMESSRLSTSDVASAEKAAAAASVAVMSRR